MILEKSTRSVFCISIIVGLLLVPVLQSLPLNLPPLLPEASAEGSIAKNNVQTNSSTLTSSPYQISISNFTVGTAENRLLVVAVEANNHSATSVTFGGASLTRVAASFNNQHTSFWYLANPSGTAKIVVTMAGSTGVVVGAYAFSGVDQGNPIPTTATYFGTGNPSISVNTIYSNSTVLDSAAIYGGQTLSSPTCTNEWHVNVSGQITGASSLKATAAPGSVTCSWTASGTGAGWDDVAIEIKASGVNNKLTDILLNSRSTAAGQGTSVTLYNFTAGTGSNRLLLVGVEANSQSVSSITFGSASLTKAVSSFTNNDAELWYLKNPGSTRANIVVTMAGSTGYVVGAYAFSGVNQTSPIATTNSTHNSAAGSPSISITTKYYNSWVIDSPAIFGGVTLSNPTCTQQWDTNVHTSANEISGASSTTIPKAPGKTTCGWTASGSGDLYDDVAAEVRSYNPSTGILIPLYDYPTLMPCQVCSAVHSHNKYSSVRMIGIINENSGDDVSNDSNWLNETKYLQQNGIIVLGYVHTSFDCTDAISSCANGKAPTLANVESNMSNYKTFYNVNGTFFDEMSSTANSGNLTYYGTLNNYSKYHLNETLTVGNPGDEPDKNFNATFDTINIFENNQSLPSSSYYSSWNVNFSKNLFSVLAWGVPSTLLNSTYYNSTAKHAGYLYFTDNTGCFHNQPVSSCWPNNNPWNTTSIYLNSTLGNLTHD